jgi:hypothetical protein
MSFSAPAVDVRELSEDYCEFQLSGVDASFANALRRVMIAEVKAVEGGRGRSKWCGERRRWPPSALIGGPAPRQDEWCGRLPPAHAMQRTVVLGAGIALCAGW